MKGRNNDRKVVSVRDADGAFFLALLERKAGLAVVSAEWLGKQPSGWPVTARQAE